METRLFSFALAYRRRCYSTIETPSSPTPVHICMDVYVYIWVYIRNMYVHILYIYQVSADVRLAGTRLGVPFSCSVSLTLGLTGEFEARFVGGSSPSLTIAFLKQPVMQVLVCGALARSLSLSLSLFLSLPLSLSLSLSLTHSHTHTHSLSHINTHSLSLSHTHTLTNTTCTHTGSARRTRYHSLR